MSNWIRWNVSTHIYELSTDDGANFAALPLNASILNEGIIGSIARIATGTPTGAKFVRDDLTLAVPAGGATVSTDLTDSANLARLNAANIFSANQNLNKIRPELLLKHDTNVALSRVLKPSLGQLDLSENLSYDGTNWNLDDTGRGGAVFSIADNIIMTRFATSGSNPRTLSEGPKILNSGVRFPATQIASSDANTLDDYEEGTWTPVIAGEGGTSGQTYGTQTGLYVKIGSFVFLCYLVSLTNKGTITGDVVIGGLPFSVGSSGVTQRDPATMRWADLNTAFVNIFSITVENTSYLYPRGIAAATTGSGVALTTTDILNSTNLQGTAVYRTTI